MPALVHDDTITYLELREGRRVFSIQKISSSSKEAIELDQERWKKFIASRRSGCSLMKNSGTIAR